MSKALFVFLLTFPSGTLLNTYLAGAIKAQKQMTAAVDTCSALLIRRASLAFRTHSMILFGSCVATANRMRSPSTNGVDVPLGTRAPLMAVPFVLRSSR